MLNPIVSFSYVRQGDDNHPSGPSVDCLEQLGSLQRHLRSGPPAEGALLSVGQVYWRRPRGARMHSSHALSQWVPSYWLACVPLRSKPAWLSFLLPGACEVLAHPCSRDKLAQVSLSPGLPPCVFTWTNMRLYCGPFYGWNNHSCNLKRVCLCDWREKMRQREKKVMKTLVLTKNSIKK